MREVIKSQLQIGEVDIANIKINLNSRDEIPKILIGLQKIYTTPYVKKTFAILEEIIPKEVDKNIGRPGMVLWRILVLGTIRLGCN